MRAASALIAVAFVLACQANPAPREWLPTPAQTPEWTHGGWIQLEMKAPNARTPGGSWGGELLAVSTDSLWVLTEQGANRVAVADVTRATLVGWDPETYLLTLWTIVGTLSTISNGAFLLFTAPAWAIGGSLATAAQSRRPLVRTEREGWPALRLYARFPQGLPPGLDLATLGTIQLGRPVR